MYDCIECEVFWGCQPLPSAMDLSQSVNLDEPWIFQNSDVFFVNVSEVWFLIFALCFQGIMGFCSVISDFGRTHWQNLHRKNRWKSQWLTKILWIRYTQYGWLGSCWSIPPVEGVLSHWSWPPRSAFKFGSYVIWRFVFLRDLFAGNCLHAPLDFCNLKYDDIIVVARSTGVVGFGWYIYI